MPDASAPHAGGARGARRRPRWPRSCRSTRPRTSRSRDVAAHVHLNPQYAMSVFRSALGRHDRRLPGPVPGRDGPAAAADDRPARSRGGLRRGIPLAEPVLRSLRALVRTVAGRLPAAAARRMSPDRRRRRVTPTRARRSRTPAALRGVRGRRAAARGRAPPPDGRALGGLTHGRQGGKGAPRPCAVVESDDPDVVGHASTGGAQRLHRARGDGVGCGEHAVDVGCAREQRVHAVAAGRVRVQRDGLDERRRR